MLSTDFSTNCEPNFIQKRILGNTSAENKGLECTTANNNIENRFPNHVFFTSTLF